MNPKRSLIDGVDENLKRNDFRHQWLAVCELMMMMTMTGRREDPAEPFIKLAASSAPSSPASTLLACLCRYYFLPNKASSGPACPAQSCSTYQYLVPSTVAVSICLRQ
jgi:hypothetical protein